MVETGWDFAWWRPTIAQLQAGGVRFVSRYLSWLPNGKVITRAEYQALRAARISVVLNWEFSAQDMKRGLAGGFKDATEALRQARALDPAIVHPVIYHSADWQASWSDYVNYIRPYLRGVAQVYGSASLVGIYGSYDVVRWALQDALAAYGWQTYAWSRGRWCVPPGHVRQVRNGLGGGNYDLDYAYAVDFGQIGSQAEPFGTPVGVYGRTLYVPKPAEETVQLKLNEPVVFANPALASGYRQWVSLTSDFGDAEVRFAWFDGNWHLEGAPTADSAEKRLLVTAAGGDVSFPAARMGIRKFSVKLTKVSAENTVVGLDVLPTPVPVES